MAEEDTTAPAKGQEDGDADPTNALGDAGKRALQTERERARKAEADLKAVRKEMDQLKANSAPKSDMEKVLAKLEASEKRSAEAERRALLGEVVAETGLSMKKVARLQGETVDDLLADAEVVFDWKPKSDKDDSGSSDESKTSTSTSRPPRDRLTANPGETRESEEMDPIKLAEMIPRY